MPRVSGRTGVTGRWVVEFLKRAQLREWAKSATVGAAYNPAAHYSTSMTLAAGTRLGPYEILAPLGAGGMGEVYVLSRRPQSARPSRVGAVPTYFELRTSNFALRTLNFEPGYVVCASLKPPGEASDPTSSFPSVPGIAARCCNGLSSPQQ